MPPLPPGGSRPGCCTGARNDDFRAALDGAFARILEAHHCEVAELQQRTDDIGREPPPEDSIALLPLPEAQPPRNAVACSVLQGCASDTTLSKPLEPRLGWVRPHEFTECAEGSDGIDKALSGSCSLVPAASATSCASGPGKVHSSSFERQTSKRFTGPHWQWKHRTGWKDYDQGPSDKIEEFFQKGHPKARLKAGKKGSNPMEIFFADMVQHDAITGNTRDVRRLGPNPWCKRLKRHVLSHYYAWETGLPRAETLETAKARKTLIERAGIGAVDSTFHAELNLYHSSGLVADVARSRVFHTCGTLLVALNAIWIAIELDNNDGPASKVKFQVVENVFCALFTMEIAIRFAAFRRKVLCLRDSWFCFDSVLVLPMVLDTWLLPLVGVLSANGRRAFVGGDLTVLRVARLLRLTRMIRVLKSMPMMMTLLRGITTSIRPVSIAVGLLLIIIYIFSILFRSLVDPGGFLEREYFHSVTYTMLFLLMHGTFLDSVGEKGFEINRDGGIFLMFLFLIYIFMTSFLMLNMLIGVVCEMVSEVKHGEHELMAKVTLRSELFDIMDVYDEDGNGTLNQVEFQRFIGNTEVMQALHKFNVDIRGLSTLSEMMFSHVSPGDEAALGFDEIMSLAVRLKGTSACRVDDLVKLRDFTKHRLQTLEEHLMTNQRMLEERLRRSFSDPAETARSPAAH